jgi:hypothetical protein
MRSSLITPAIKSAAKKFKGMFDNGYQSLYEACQLYVSILQQGKKQGEAFREAIPEIPVAAWKEYERVGRGTLHVNLIAFRSCPGVKALGKLPMVEQETFSNKPIKMLLTNGRDHVNVPIHDLTTDQAKQIFDPAFIRDVPQQKVWLEDQKAKQIRSQNLANSGVSKEKPVWKIVGKNRVKIGKYELTKKDILSILNAFED